MIDINEDLSIEISPIDPKTTWFYCQSSEIKDAVLAFADAIGMDAGSTQGEGDFWLVEVYLPGPEKGKAA